MITGLSFSIEKFIYIINSLKEYHEIFTHASKILPIECNHSIDIVTEFIQTIEEISQYLNGIYLISTSKGVCKYNVLTYSNSIKNKMQYLSSVIYKFSLICLENTYKKEVLQNVISHEFETLIESCNGMKQEVECLFQHYTLENINSRFIH